MGNVCLGLAALLYAILLFVGSQMWNLPRSDQSLFFVLALLLPLLWLCLGVALFACVATGGLDWLSASRGGQKTIVVVSCLSMVAVTWCSGCLRREPADQMPWAVRPMVPGAWALWVFPAVVLVYCLATLNAGTPSHAFRVPLGLAGGLSLLVTAGMLFQWMADSQRSEQARGEAIVSREEQRIQTRIEEVRALDAARDFSQLLGYTNRFDDPKVRQPALEKLRALPDLEVQLAAGLRSDSCEQVLIFLDASDPPDRRALAEPVRDCFSTLAASTRETMRDQKFPVFPGNVDYDARLILSVANQFAGLGVDYAPAIRSFRGALNEPRPEKLKFESAAALDDWLARDAKRPK